MDVVEDEHRRSGFDKLAAAYRWMEYASFGPLLQRTRVQFVADVVDARQALVLGDGDGRFCVYLLRQAQDMRVTAVDASAAMLRQTVWRAGRANVGERLTTVHGNAATTILPEGEFDLVCTHYFLDCLSEAEVLQLVRQISQRWPGAAWLVSEFAIPPRGAARVPAWLLVRALYAAFGMLTGLPVQQLPNYAAILRRHDYVLQKSHTRLGGLLRAELWRPAGEGAAASHGASNTRGEMHA